MSSFDYNYIVLGGGSGGIASAKRAAQLYGAKVAVIEKARLGGTCVNVGCVPKKIMYLAASMSDVIRHDAAQYCFKVPPGTTFDWGAMKIKRDAYVTKLNGIYGRGLDSAHVDYVHGEASFADAHTITVTLDDGSTKTITGDKILIATGGRPLVPPEEGIAEHTITSDGFFELQELPPVVVVVGAGYIAVELAGVLNALGSQTHLVVRKHKALREFDPDISDMLDEEMQKAGIVIHRNTSGVAKITLDQNGKKTVHLVSGDVSVWCRRGLDGTGTLAQYRGLELGQGGCELGCQGTDCGGRVSKHVCRQYLCPRRCLRSCGTHSHGHCCGTSLVGPYLWRHCECQGFV